MSRTPSSLLLLSLLLGVAACPSEGGGGGGIDPGDPDGGPVSADGGGADGGGADAGALDGGDPTPVGPRLIEGLRIAEVELYQALQVPLMIGGAEVAPGGLPRVADREALLLVHLSPEAGWSPRSVTAELEIGPPGGEEAPLRQTLTVNGAADTPFELLVPPERMTIDARWSLRLVSDAAEPIEDDRAHPGRFPVDGGDLALGAEADAGGIELVLVPVQYDRDGSGRLPDTSPEQLRIIEELLTALYPIASVQITVREPLPWNDPLTPFTRNFDFYDLNAALKDLKAADGAASTTYYYGLVQPADTFSAYCGRSCTTGQAYAVTDPTNGDERVGGGMGYPGERWAWTLAHELGHMHGRFHAPCGVSSWDADFPHADATLGVWGYDRRSATFLDPLLHADLMGYCDEQWISDYTYAAIFERVLTLNAMKRRKRVPRGVRAAAAICSSSSTALGPSCVCETGR